MDSRSVLASQSALICPSSRHLDDQDGTLERLVCHYQQRLKNGVSDLGSSGRTQGQLTKDTFVAVLNCSNVADGDCMCIPTKG